MCSVRFACKCKYWMCMQNERVHFKCIHTHTHTFDERSAEHNKKTFKTVAILWLDTDIVISIKIWILLLPPPWCSCFHVDLIFFPRLFRFYYHLRAGISMLIFSHFMRITLEFCIWTESSLLLNDSKFRDSKQNNSYFLCWTNAVSSNKQIFDEPIDARRQVKSNRINDFICND